MKRTIEKLRDYFCDNIPDDDELYETLDLVTQIESRINEIEEHLEKQNLINSKVVYSFWKQKGVL